jgi:hypothetical protein
MTGTRGAVWSVIISLQIKITSLLLAKSSALTLLNYSPVLVTAEKKLYVETSLQQQRTSGNSNRKYGNARVWVEQISDISNAVSGTLDFFYHYALTWF